jgi:hypothetical protein
MNEQPITAPSIWDRSSSVRFFLWLFSWRGIRRVLIVLAWMATIIALFIGEENWRGRRAWNQYRQATEARGESLDFAAYVPKPVPDDRNFAATPFLGSFFQPGISILTNDLFARAADYIPGSKHEQDKSPRQFVDLVAWQMASAALRSGPLKAGQQFKTDQAGLAARAAAAPAIMEGMQPDAAVFAELRAASAREFSRYPVKYDLENPWAILLPHLGLTEMVCNRLKLQACAELVAGQASQALSDVKLILSLADSFKSEPFLISALVRLRFVDQIAIQPVWEGLAEHRWTDAQLQELQARFLSYDFPADLQQSLKVERACGILAVDLVKKQGIGRFILSGWLCQEKLNYCTLFDAQRKGVVDLEAKTISPDKVASNSDELTRQIYGGNQLKALLHHRAIAAMMLPALNRVEAKVAAAQTAADQAALACALERYRLANGQFPETLEALTPQFISRPPNDAITGQPYKYRRSADGQYILYSVGWNEKDDGGVPGKSLFDQSQGDWVWSYPTQ